MVLRLPQPFRTLFWLALVSWVILVIDFATPAADGGIRWSWLPFTLVMFLAGLVYALDFRGNASRVIELSKQEGAVAFPLIVMRLLGVGIMALGIMFFWLILSGRM